MALSSNSKRGLALTALLPVLLSVYSEYRKDAEAQAQRLSARIELTRKQREIEQERDLDNARRMLATLTGDVADPNDAQHDGSFCNHLFVTSELVRFTRSSRATRQVLNSALEYPDKTPEAGAVPRPLACQCGSELSLMRTSWAPSRRTTASLPVVAEMTETLGRVIELCEPEPAMVPAAASGAASTPTRQGVAPVQPSPVPVLAAAPVPPAAGRTPAPVAIVQARPQPAAPDTRAAAPVPAPITASAAPTPAGAADGAICTGASPDKPLRGPFKDAPVTVYIQIATEAQRPIAQRLQQALASAGYEMPGIQRVGVPRSLRSPELRFFRVEDGAAVDGLVDDLRIVCPSEFDDAAAPKLLASLRKEALPRTFEIWFPKPAAGARP